MERDGKMDVHLDVSDKGYAGRLEVIEGPRGRRRRSEAEKARIAAESLMPGVRVAEVARKYEVTRWQIYDWRKRLHRQEEPAHPENVAAVPAFAALLVDEPRPKSKGVRIEIVVKDIVIRIDPTVEGDHLARVIRAVRASQ